MSLQSSYLLRSLFFGILIRYPSLQSVDTCSYSQILLSRTWSIFTVTSMSDFSWYFVWFCCFPTLGFSDGHADFLDRWWGNTYGEVSYFLLLQLFPLSMLGLPRISAYQVQCCSSLSCMLLSIYFVP